MNERKHHDSRAECCASRGAGSGKGAAGRGICTCNWPSDVEYPRKGSRACDNPGRCSSAWAVRLQQREDRCYPPNGGGLAQGRHRPRLLHQMVPEQGERIRSLHQW